MATVRIPPCCGRKPAGSRKSRPGGDRRRGPEGADHGVPDTKAQLFGEDGDLNRYVNVYLNDETCGS